MPQLWTETFITQYFWLLASFLTLYIFVYTVLIPNISIAIKSRNNPIGALLSIDKTEENTTINIGAVNLIELQAKEMKDDVTESWLTLNPETDKTYWQTESAVSEISGLEYEEWEKNWAGENNLNDLEVSDLMEEEN